MLDVEGETLEDAQKRLVCLLNRHRGCIAMSTEELGCISLTCMKIEDSDIPVHTKPCKMNQAERVMIAGIIEEWKKNGIVQESNSEYSSPVILVPKKNGIKRLVCDFRKLNNQTKKRPFPMSILEDLFEGLHQANIFTILDLAQGYLQVPIEEDSIHKTAIVAPDEKVEFTRMVFGLTNATYLNIFNSVTLKCIKK